MSTLSNFIGRGKMSSSQLDLVDIFNVIPLLKQRGFSGITEGKVDDTLLDEKANPKFKRDLNGIPNWVIFDDFIKKFNDRPFRLMIRDMIIKRPSSVGMEYIFNSSSENEKRYANTFELLVAYLCVKELSALSASFSVHIDNAPNGGDFDCLANFQNSLFHFEVKSGDIKNIKKDSLQSFLNRHYFLAPNASILFLDYQGGSKEELKKLIFKFKGLQVGPRIINRIFKISDGAKKFYTLGADLIVVDLHNNSDLISNLRFAVQYFHKFNAMSLTRNYDMFNPRAMGYDTDEIVKLL